MVPKLECWCPCKVWRYDAKAFWKVVRRTLLSGC